MWGWLGTPTAGGGDVAGSLSLFLATVPRALPALGMSTRVREPDLPATLAGVLSSSSPPRWRAGLGSPRVSFLSPAMLDPPYPAFASCLLERGSPTLSPPVLGFSFSLLKAPFLLVPNFSFSPVPHPDPPPCPRRFCATPPRISRGSSTPWSLQPSCGCQKEIYFFVPRLPPEW